MKAAKKVATTEAPEYTADNDNRPIYSDDWIIAQAIAILEDRLAKAAPGPTISSPKDVRNLLTLRHAAHPDREVFEVVWLTAQHKVITIEQLAKGTLNQASVYPREVVKAALRHNAAAAVLSHNHPSGSLEPSQADKMLTQTLKTALATIDVRVLDHIITAGGNSMSFAEKGLI